MADNNTEKTVKKDGQTKDKTAESTETGQDAPQERDILKEMFTEGKLARDPSAEIQAGQVVQGLWI